MAETARKKLRILILNDLGTPSGGAELLTLSLRDELRRRGHDARVFASTAGSQKDTFSADYQCRGTTSALRNFNRTANFSARRQLKRVLDDFRPDIVHVRMFLTQLSPLILPLLRGIPALYHASWYATVCPNGHKLLPNNNICQVRAGAACFHNGCYGAVGWSTLMVQRQFLQRWRSVFDHIVANSTAVQQQLLENGIEPVEIVWNGVPDRAVRPPLKSPPTVSFAGRLSPEKGVDLLVQAFALVVEQNPAARILIAGDGPQRRTIEQQIGDLGLREKVTLLGHLPQEEMERQLAPAWVQVVPSRLQEPFGLVAAEAMMRGTAVIASNSGGLAEIVVDDETGYCVPPSDKIELATAVGKILNDRAMAERMGHAGRSRALAHFSHDRFVNKFVRIYENLLRE